MLPEVDPNPQKPNLTALIGWGFQALLLAVGTWGVSEISNMSKSIQELNIKMAVTIERDGARERRIEDLELRVKDLERHRK